MSSGRGSTQAWRSSDSPKAFVRALEDLGYVLATGKRPYVLVDVYGEVNALAKLIDDKTVRTKNIRDFFGQEFAPESLPSVEEAQALIAHHRQAIEDFNKANAKADEQENLAARQAERRQEAEKDLADLKTRQARVRVDLLRRQKEDRSALRSVYLDEMKRRRVDRARHAPKGLAAFLGQITGVALITKKLHRYRDRKRFEAFLSDRVSLNDRQKQEQLVLSRSQWLEAADVTRKLRALDQVEQRERRSLETTLLKERRIDEHRRHDHRMPPVRARSRDGSKPRRVTNPYTSTFARELAERAQAVKLRADFAKAAANEETAHAEGEASKAPTRNETEQARGPRRHVVTDVNLQGDFEHAATHMGNYSGEDTASSDGPNPPVRPTQKPPRPKRPLGRKRDKNFDRSQ